VRSVLRLAHRPTREIPQRNTGSRRNRPITKTPVKSSNPVPFTGSVGSLPSSGTTKSIPFTHLPRLLRETVPCAARPVGQPWGNSREGGEAGHGGPRRSRPVYRVTRVAREPRLASRVRRGVRRRDRSGTVGSCGGRCFPHGAQRTRRPEAVQQIGSTQFGVHRFRVRPQRPTRPRVWLLGKLNRPADCS
jgi:hypothetical protein